MPTYSSDALDVVLDEVRRVRDLQSTRIDSLRNRAGIQIGASGIAAGLLSSMADSPLWLVPVGAFLIAAICGVLSILPGKGQSVDPLKVYRQADDKDAVQVKANVIAGIISEYQVQENKLGWPAVATRIGTGFFVLGIALIAAVAIYSLANPGAAEPIDIRIVEG